MGRDLLECGNCGHVRPDTPGGRRVIRRTGVGTLCGVCLDKLAHPERWAPDPAQWAVVVRAWRERLSRDGGR